MSQNPIDTIMNAGSVGADTLDQAVADMNATVVVLQDGMNLLVEKATQLANHERIMSTSSEPGHFKMGLGFEYDPASGRHNVTGSFAFNEEMGKLETRLNAQRGSLSSNLYVPLPDIDLPQPTESAFRLPAGASEGDGVDVDGLGRFCWSSTSTDPVDYETCLLAAGSTSAQPGRWLLVLPDWTALCAVFLRSTDAQDVAVCSLVELQKATEKRQALCNATVEARISALKNSLTTLQQHVRTTTVSLKFPSVPASGGVQKQKVPLSGSRVHDAVFVSCPTLVGGLFSYGVVEEAGTVTVCLLNAKTSALTPATSDYSITVVGATKSGMN